MTDKANGRSEAGVFCLRIQLDVTPTKRRKRDKADGKQGQQWGAGTTAATVQCNVPLTA